MERDEIIETCIPISLSNKTWEQEVKSMAPRPHMSECIMALEAPGWRSDELNFSKAIDSLYGIRGRLQELLEHSLYVLNTTIGGDNGREEALDSTIREALELL